MYTKYIVSLHEFPPNGYSPRSFFGFNVFYDLAFLKSYILQSDFYGNIILFVSLVLFLK